MGALDLQEYLPEGSVFIFVLLCLVAGSVDASINAPLADVERELTFTAYRLREPINRNRNYKFSYDAVSINQSALRRCLVVRWRALAGKKLDDVIVAATGAILVIVPPDMLPPESQVVVLKKRYDINAAF